MMLTTYIMFKFSVKLLWSLRVIWGSTALFEILPLRGPSLYENKQALAHDNDHLKS